MYLTTRTLYSSIDVGFAALGQSISANTLTLNIENIPYITGTFQWVVKANKTDLDSNSISANTGNLSGANLSHTISLPANSFVIGNTYYYALRVFNGSGESQEIIQVSFTIAQNAVLGAGTAVVNLLPTFIGKLTTLQRNAFNAGTQAYLIFNTTTSQLEQYNPSTSVWSALGGGGGSQDLSAYATNAALTAGLNAKQNTLGFTPENVTNKNVVSGYAGLDGAGKINPSQLPALAITDTFVVASQALMLALVAETGDVAVRTDISKSFILRGANPTILANWQELLTPTDLVSSVFARSGVVTAQSGDYNTSQVTENTNLYFTPARALSAILTGLSTASSAEITTASSALEAFGQLQAQITANIARTTSVNTSQSGSVAAGAAASTDYTYIFTTTGTLTLPTAVGNQNRYVIKTTAGVITINTTSSQTIDNSATVVISVPFTSITLISNNLNWNII